MERILTTVFTAAIFLGALVRGEDDDTFLPPKSLVIDTSPTPTRDPNMKIVLVPGPTVTSFTTPSATPNNLPLDAPAVDNIPLIIGLVVGISVLCLLIILGIWFVLRKRRSQPIDCLKMPEEEWERGSYRESIRTLGESRVGSRLGHLGHMEISRPQMAMAVSVRSTRSLDSKLIVVDGPGGGLGPLGTRELI